MNDEVKSELLINMIKEGIYENTLVVIQWLGDITEATAVAAFKTSVNKLENVFAQG